MTKPNVPIGKSIGSTMGVLQSRKKMLDLLRMGIISSVNVFHILSVHRIYLRYTQKNNLSSSRN